MNHQVMFKLSYGLYMLSTKTNKKTNGCIINTAIQVTQNPEQMAIAVNKLNLTCEMIQESKKFTLSIISSKAKFHLFQNFGFQSGRDAEKFSGISFDSDQRDIPYLTEQCCGYISCDVVNEIDLGSHIMFIAEVKEMEEISKDTPLTYSDYHANVKPKPEEKKNTEKKTIWRCTICGYEYEGEELPKDFICPICKHGASDFVKVEN